MTVERDPMAETRVVKRYANRKLYDTQRSRYVTLEQIAEMIRAGEDVKIVDNNSQGRSDGDHAGADHLRGGEEAELPAAVGAAQHHPVGRQHRSSSWPSQAGETRARASSRGDKDEQRRAGGEPMRRRAGEPAAAIPIREFLERSQQTFDEWQKKVDERIRQTVEALSPLASLEKEMRALAQRLAELEKRLEERD